MAEWGESRIEAANASAHAVKALVGKLNNAIFDAVNEGILVDVEHVTHNAGGKEYPTVIIKMSLGLPAR